MNEMLIGLMASVGGLLFLLVGSVVGSIVMYLLSRLIYKYHKILGLVFSMFSIFFIPFGMFVFVAMCLKFAKDNKKEINEQTRYINSLANAPNDQKIDEFMAWAEKEGGVIGNHPTYWNMIRNLWFAVNKSPNVTTNKKREFCIWLQSKGLILSDNQSKIISNYNKNGM